MPEVIHLFDRPVSLDGILDGLPIGVLILDPERRVVSTNRAAEALTALDGREARGLPCHYVLRANLCPKKCPALAARARDGSAVGEGDVITRDRRKVPVRLTSVAVKDAKGRIAGFLETVEDLTQARPLESRPEGLQAFGEMLGKSAAMVALFRLVPVVAQTDSSVLLTGETGTGKDLLAEAVHRASGRSNGPFVKVNCGALPETLMESELFGHSKGAFTGAVESRSGRIRLAHSGTLYLTEIGDLALQLQVKLLTFLDDKVVYPLGGAKGFPTDVRLIAGTNKNLERMVDEGSFRQDLLYRLNVVRIHLPPLRERNGDIVLLLDHFLHHYARRFGKRVAAYSPEARRLLQAYDYPGNVRELRNLVEYAVNFCQADTVGTEHLPPYLTEGPTPAEPADRAELGSPPQEKSPQKRNWEDAERELILNALKETRGRRAKAASLLGWARSTLWRKMKQYGISE